MDSMAEFETYLRTAAPANSGLRPFVCSGSPLECSIALVGYNPATNLEADFWNFWNSARGFDKANWFETYKVERQNRPLKPGKTRRNAVSPTRKRIELFIEGVGDYKCLETNLYWDASEDIASHVQGSRPLVASLLKQLPLLKLIVCHHEAAFRFLKPQFPDIQIEHVDHFANRKRGWSDSAALELGQRMGALLAKSV
ncbi:hypothetical protein [Hoeflea ulvae]|uniref:Uracil-DNA glycosylase-like domain-containing protein n=1 Tax=Hoeflea ulvae TaxID=2983764 RepID=A0ABT3YH62_9HYPH|nr:hypothetical protein [Hoeflea ulvae]MCY0095070.1 hypothetical protein [Hoeflea ulvae]